jgi:tetratricopeptide (TPR) repeat protein
MKKSHSALGIILLLAPIIGRGQNNETPQAYSLSGKPLFSPAPDAKVLWKSDSVIQTIRSKSNLSEDDFIEIGKQLVATARYKEAVENYTTGLNKFPESFKLLRHRGHRYLTLRKLDLALNDLLKARDLIKSQPDTWEFDTEGKKTDTYQHQIEYHLGVDLFLHGAYKKAVKAFEKSLKEAHVGNEIVGTTDWLYHSYQRNGQEKEAQELLITITPDFNADHEQAYFRRIMFYKGIIKPNELVDETAPPEKLTIQDVTKLYGLANWYAFQGNKEKAKELYAKIIQSNSWPAFAYLASEIELAKNLKP